MKNITLILFFSAIFTASCQSFVPTSIELDSSLFDGKKLGVVSELTINDTYILFQDQSTEEEYKISFSQSLDTEAIDKIRKSDSFIFFSRPYPDGPVEAVYFYRNQNLEIYLGDQIKPGRIPELSLAYRNTLNTNDAIIIFDGKNEWILKTGDEKIIQIDGYEYRASLLNLIKGDPQFDQPPLRIDLMLIRVDE